MVMEMVMVTAKRWRGDDEAEVKEEDVLFFLCLNAEWGVNECGGRKDQRPKTGDVSGFSLHENRAAASAKSRQNKRWGRRKVGEGVSI